MSEHAPLPFIGPNWRPLPDAIAFLCRCFRSVRMARDKLYAALVSGDLPSVLEREVGGRVVRERLTRWEEIDFTIAFSIDNPEELTAPDDDIEIVLGNELLSPHSIFICWPSLERLWQPEPAVQSEPVTQAKPRRKGSREQDSIRLIADETWPDGWQHIGTGQIMKIVGDKLKKMGLPVPKRDVFLRALGRQG